jgi:hypothetical protein
MTSDQGPMLHIVRPGTLATTAKAFDGKIPMMKTSVSTDVNNTSSSVCTTGWNVCDGGATMKVPIYDCETNESGGPQICTLKQFDCYCSSNRTDIDESDFSFYLEPTIKHNTDGELDMSTLQTASSYMMPLFSFQPGK